MRLSAALDAAAAGVAAVGGKRGGGARELPGSGLSSLALVALLHVSKKPREGIPVAIDVLQEIVRLCSRCWFARRRVVAVVDWLIDCMFD